MVPKKKRWKVYVIIYKYFLLKYYFLLDFVYILSVKTEMGKKKN